MSLIRNVLKPLGKSVLISLLLTTAVSATDAFIHKKMFASGNTTWTISNDETNNIMKVIKSLEESGLLINNQNNRIKQLAEQSKRKQKDGFISMLLGTLGASLLGNLSTGSGKIEAGEGTIRTGHNF